MGVKHSQSPARDCNVNVSVPLRGNGCETPHIFEAYTVKLLMGAISIGHLYSQKTCQICKKDDKYKSGNPYGERDLQRST